MSPTVLWPLKCYLRNWVCDIKLLVSIQAQKVVNHGMVIVPALLLSYLTVIRIKREVVNPPGSPMVLLHQIVK